MKYEIQGFSQKVLVKYGLDDTDALILRYFVDFKDTGLMISEEVDGETYYWIRYDRMIEELPILNLKKNSIYKRMKKMCEAKILIHMTFRVGGTYSYYGIGENYAELVCTPNDLNNNLHKQKVETPVQENPEQNIHLLKDSSTKKKIYNAVLEILNDAANTSYKASTKKTRQLIDARLSEKFTLEDFKSVILKKSKQWKGTSMEKYLRPETLFGTKFEGYLNEKANLEDTGGSEGNPQSVYKDFKFDFLEDDDYGKDGHTSTKL